MSKVRTGIYPGTFDPLHNGHMDVIRRAMAEAGIGPADVDHVNAAAAGDPRLDAWEARAIADVFGRETPVYAPKAHFGNTGAAGGLLELAASVGPVAAAA